MVFPFGVYIHFPFCRSKCGYCDFASLACAAGRIPHHRYAETVLAELEARAARYADGELRSIYFGGGTPSLWRRAELRRVVEGVRATFGRGPVPLEITVEVNPGTVDSQGFEELLAAGVNRLSLGLQALDDEALRRLGRSHTAEQGRRAVREARAAGFENLACDLMAGLPGQRLSDHLEHLERLLELAPDHVSVYALTLSRHAPMRRAGWAPVSAELQAELLEAGADRLERAGLPQYEVSNFAPPTQRSRHNALVWAGWPYLGLGASAHSMWAEGPRTLRVANLALPGYLRRRGAPAGLPWPVAELEWVEEPASRLEMLFMGLRTVDGVGRGLYRQRFGADPEEHFGPTLQVLAAGGWLRLDSERIAPTRRGLWLADELALRLASPVTATRNSGSCE